MIAPGSTLGILGGGQLGRMFSICARKMGYRIHTFEPTPQSPAGQTSDLEINAPYTDIDALMRFTEGVSAITFEFENIPADVLETVARRVPMHPGANVLLTCQDREREKTFLKKHGYPHAPFEVVTSAGELAAALAKTGSPCVLKTAAFGYDGKGQIRISPGADPEEIWKRFGASRGVLESWVEFECELSVICARTAGGEILCFPPAENIHTQHILDLSIAPGRFSPGTGNAAQEIARSIADDLKLVGLLAVEFFLDRAGNLFVNELAPRPHNSGHYSFDSCLTSQFEQQLRAVCGIPLGSPRLLAPTVMVNLLGDLWNNGEPDWSTVLSEPSAKLHLYGKKEARPGRKMGHFCVLDDSVETALEKATAIRAKLRGTGGQGEVKRQVLSS